MLCWQLMNVDLGRGIYADVPFSSHVSYRVACCPVCGRSDASITCTSCMSPSPCSSGDFYSLGWIISACVFQRPCAFDFIFDTRVLLFRISYETRNSLDRLLDVQICASILGTDWSPVLSVVSVCVTLQSMLASCKVRLLIRLSLLEWLC